MSEAGGGEIHKADPARRWLLALLAPLGAAALYGLSRSFNSYLEHLPVESTGQMRHSSLAVLAAIQFSLYAAAALLGALALYWFTVSRRMHAAERYPLPQMRLFHDMRVLRGAAKQLQARRLGIGAALAATGAVMALTAALYAPRHEALAHPILFDQSLPDHRFDEVFGKPTDKPAAGQPAAPKP